MIKSLVKHGNSWALVIDRPILDLLHIDPEGTVEISTDGQSMTVTPVGKGSRKAAVRGARKSTLATVRLSKSWRNSSPWFSS